MQQGIRSVACPSLIVYIMLKLKDIPSLPDDAVDLLGAVGYLDATDLAEVNTESLQAELAQANVQLKIIDVHPTSEQIEEWKRATAEHSVSGVTDDFKEDALVASHTQEVVVTGDDSEFVNFENDPEVQKMLKASPEALPLNPLLIRHHEINVLDIPEGVLLSHCHGETEIKLTPVDRMTTPQRHQADDKRTGLIESRIRSFDEAGEITSRVKPLERGEQKMAVTPSEGLNVGVSPESRRFVRGVMHPNPWSVRTSAIFAVLVEIMLIANFIGIPWLLYHEYASGENMAWWVLGLASGLFLSALLYLFCGISSRCRVCGQRQFAPKKCIKNKKAHHIPLVGYIFPTALHAIFFKWFYCTYCGTAVRLKK